jgi:hypothetical protein
MWIALHALGGGGVGFDTVRWIFVFVFFEREAGDLN